MWSLIMVFFGTMSLFMTLWILDSSTSSAAFGSIIVRGLMTTVFGLLTITFWYTSYEIYAGTSSSEEGEDSGFISKDFRRRR